MIHRRLTIAAAVVAGTFGTARAQSGDASVRHLGHAEVAAAFAKGTPMIEVEDYKIHASRREGPGTVEVHTRDTDIAYVLQGSATLVTGGTANGLRQTAPEELRGGVIEGGVTRRVGRGDVVVIPNGTPHWFKAVTGPFLYYVVKVRQAARETASGAM